MPHPRAPCKIPVGSPQKLMSLQPFGYWRAGALARRAFRLPWWSFVIPAIGDMFSSLMFNQRMRRFWNDRAEADFGPENGASLTDHGRKSAAVFKVSTPRHRTDATGPSVGILLYLASVGLIAAAIIGVFFGAGFWPLASSASETISDSDRDLLRPNGMETPHSAAVNLIPGSPLGQRLAAAEAAPPKQNNVTQELSPASPNGEPLVETPSVPQPVSSAAVLPVDPVPLARPPAVAAADGALSAGTRGPSAHDGRSAHARTVSRHSRTSARATSALTPP